jgi:hypothetical protein
MMIMLMFLIIGFFTGLYLWDLTGWIWFPLITPVCTMFSVGVVVYLGTMGFFWAVHRWCPDLIHS